MAGGHGEWFVQDFASDGRPSSELASLVPEAAASRGALQTIAGSRSSELAALLSEPHEVIDGLPDARQVTRLAPDLYSDTIAPVYGRGPDARLPA